MTMTPDLNSCLVGRSTKHYALLEMIDRIKDVNVPVLIRGESGTGKEVVARSIHETGLNRRGRFVAINCSAIPEALIESELFGFSRGAFTGAVQNRPGLIEEADGGSFFLDEIGDLPLALQAKLLRLLEEKKIRRIGENRTRDVSPRFISATNKALEQEIEMGRFREDLYYRLKIIVIELPPLRERKEDIPCLLEHFARLYSGEWRRPCPSFSPGAVKKLISYDWPGNIRELQSEVQRCLILGGEETILTEDHLSLKLNPTAAAEGSAESGFYRAKAAFEREYISEALARFNFNRVLTARNLGLSRQGLFKLMKKHNIADPRRRHECG